MSFWQTASPGQAEAATPSVGLRHRVLIVANASGDSFMDRVAAEVRAVAGVEIVVQPPSATLDVDARRIHAEVAIRKLASGRGVEVWMADATSGRSLLRQVIIDESPSGPDESLIALQTAEIVRTSLNDEAPSDEVARPSPPVAGAASTSGPGGTPNVPADKSSLQAGIAFLSSRGNSSTALQTWFSYQYSWLPHLGFSLDLSTPLVKGAINGSQGTADVGVFFVGGGLTAPFGSDSGHLSLAATLGGGITTIQVDGRPTADFQRAPTTVRTGLVYLRLQGGWNPRHWLGLGASAMFGTTTTRIHVEFANQDVGEWGMPVVAAGLYGALRWK